MCAAASLLRVTLAVALVAATPARAAETKEREPSTAAIDRATARWKALAGDKRQRQRRDLWQKALGALEKAAAEASCPARATGYVRAGELSAELFRVSRTRPDLERAESLFVRGAEACGGTHGWARAAAMARRRGADAALVRRYDAQATRAGAKAQAPELKGVMGAVPAMDRAAAREALEKATKRWKALRGDANRRLVRRFWLEATGELDEVGLRHAPAPEAALAWMRAGKAAEELSRLSKRRADAQEAVRLYLAVADRCPDDTLADDALLAAAALEQSRLGRVDEARALLAKAAALKGDLAAEAGRRLAALAPEAPGRAQEIPPSALENRPAPAAEPAEEAAELGALMVALETRQTRAAPAALPLPASGQLAEAMRGLRTTASPEVEFSLSEQVGLKVRRIVIDAGHGGHDTGAIGPTGVREKDVTLAIARTLSAELRARGYEVVLTRDSDVFLALEERTSLANRERGDLFISVHANAHKSRKKGGIETYTLNVTSDRYAIRLAARENAATERSVSDLQFVLADLAMRSNTVDSGRLAKVVQEQLVQRTGRVHGAMRNLGTKQALFYVLLGARMPAILVETAFLSNPAEEKKLADERFQGTVAAAIAEGVDAFVARRLRLAAAE